MTPTELFEEKKDLVFYAIGGRFGSLAKAKVIAEMNNMEFDDLVQVGHMTLWNLCLNSTIEKVKEFDPYAIQAMKWDMGREVHEKGKTIRVTSNVTKEEREKLNFHSIDLYRDGEIVNDFFAISPVNVEDNALNSVELCEIFKVLNESEKYILMQKSYGYSDKAIGRKIGKSDKAVNKIKSRAFLKLNPNYSPEHASKILTLVSKRKNHLRQQVI